ncbi:cob(I)yrinic acid a,c-diamide adenosyltransferase [Fodinisporobacter ferrooxydans]|uniref:Corrinoid adenosyltransferase n=1 Tax=Fodinisporobacter ferrooxydans TaxID=2901836 RepID=A0ABY4CNY9_9BACL|nr:cob(I)yrinic acid a,c-diamide adenosyltransferase [Alicyclobacillaceae bacterium MYW30-H2]
MKLYTRTGDQGMTGVVGGRIRKDAIRVEAYGTVDELNAVIGQAISELDPNVFHDVIRELTEIQLELFDAGADLANVTKNPAYKIAGSMIDRLEVAMDTYEKEIPPIRRFVLPGGSKAAAVLHVARVVARRAERRVVTLAEQESINLEVRKYLNRLSDYLFMIARLANARQGISDIEYVRGGDVFK